MVKNPRRRVSRWRQVEIILATTVSRIKNEILSLKCFGGFSLPLNFLIAPCVSVIVLDRNHCYPVDGAIKPNKSNNMS